MKNPYDELLKRKQQSVVAKNYAARTLNAATFRMFKKGQSARLRKFLMRRIGDGHELCKCRNGDVYAKRLASIVHSFQREFRMSKSGQRPNFGQAAKVVNLYVKHLLMLPDYLVSYSRRRLHEYAHVPLDKQILGRMWGDKKKDGDFREELNNSGICRRPLLRTLEKGEYTKIQRVLADAAQKRRIPTIAYDYLYALRDE